MLIVYGKVGIEASITSLLCIFICKMKTYVALPTFSSSVANIIDWAREDPKDPAFLGSEVTTEFM